MGVYRWQIQLLAGIYKCPHVRGGVPRLHLAVCSRLTMSPRAWGCTGARLAARRHGTNVPTCVGVYRHLTLAEDYRTECPHVRGGVPPGSIIFAFRCQMSPRAWGCTVRGQVWGKTGNQCPHVRGGVPAQNDNPASAPLMSPRAWGCTARSFLQASTTKMSPRAWGCTDTSSSRPG